MQVRFAGAVDYCIYADAAALVGMLHAGVGRRYHDPALFSPRYGAPA
jgi:hypothetical protein